jgi:hypothetical protein
MRWRPYFVEEIRQDLEETRGSAAVWEMGPAGLFTLDVEITEGREYCFAAWVCANTTNVTAGVDR